MGCDSVPGTPGVGLTRRGRGGTRPPVGGSDQVCFFYFAVDGIIWIGLQQDIYIELYIIYIYIYNIYILSGGRGREECVLLPL